MHCPNCHSIYTKQEALKPVNGDSTTRKYREEHNLKIDTIQTLICRPLDPTWFGCIMCNTEFDNDGNVYSVRKMWPFFHENESCEL